MQLVVFHGRGRADWGGGFLVRVALVSLLLGKTFGW